MLTTNPAFSEELAAELEALRLDLSYAVETRDDVYQGTEEIVMLGGPHASVAHMRRTSADFAVRRAEESLCKFLLKHVWDIGIVRRVVQFPKCASTADTMLVAQPTDSAALP